MSAWTGRVDLSQFAERPRDLLALVLALAVAGYIAWAISQSPQQALQFTFNGLSVGAIYALLAIGFTLVYSTVWFFDLYYGAAAAIGAYGIFYLRSGEALGGLYQVNDPAVNVVFALVTAGVAWWAVRECYGRRLRERFGSRSALGIEALVAGRFGRVYGRGSRLAQRPQRLLRAGDWSRGRCPVRLGAPPRGSAIGSSA